MNIQKALRFFAASLGLVSILALPAASAFAAVTASSPVTTQVSSDTAVSGFVNLPAITLTEGLAGDIPVGNVIFALPAGFVFSTSTMANVAYTGTGLAGNATVSYPDSTHATVTVTATSSVAGTLSIGSTTPLAVRALTGTPFAASGSIMLSSGALPGLATSTNFGTLTQVAGAVNLLSFTIQPPASVNVGSTFSATVSVKDQFGNVVTSDNGRAISLSVSPVSPTTTTGTLSGIIAINDAFGVSAFTGLSFNQAGTIALVANASSVSSSTSTNILVMATSTPTPTTTPTSTPPSRLCSLRNGILVKVQGSSTIYMVVNCVLRPFTSAAIFHAKGKKFQDIQEISSAINLGIGKAIGDGDDNDSTIIIPPSSTSTASSTLPNVSGLPDGSVVKLPDSPTIYMVSGGALQPFTSAITFSLRGKKFSDVKTISQEQFSQMTVGSPVSLPDGTVVKGSGKTVFIIQNGQAQAVTSPGALSKRGKSFKDVKKISDGDLGSLPRGEDAD